MALSPELKRMVSGKGGNAINRVPNPASFAKLSIVDQSAVIEAVHRRNTAHDWRGYSLASHIAYDGILGCFK